MSNTDLYRQKFYLCFFLIFRRFKAGGSEKNVEEEAYLSTLHILHRYPIDNEGCCFNIDCLWSIFSINKQRWCFPLSYSTIIFLVYSKIMTLVCYSGYLASLLFSFFQIHRSIDSSYLAVSMVSYFAIHFLCWKLFSEIIL